MRVLGKTTLSSATAVVLGAMLMAPTSALAATPERDALEAAIKHSKQVYASGVVTQTSSKFTLEGQSEEVVVVAGLLTNADGVATLGWMDTSSSMAEVDRQGYVRSGNTATGYASLEAMLKNVGWSKRVKNIVADDVTKRGGSRESLVSFYVETANDDEFTGYQLFEYQANPAVLLEFYLGTSEGVTVTSRTDGDTTEYTVQSEGEDAPVTVTADAQGRITGYTATDALGSTSEAKVLAYGDAVTAPDWMQARIDSPLPGLAVEYSDGSTYLKEALAMAQRDAQATAERRGGKVTKPMLRKALAQAELIIPQQFRIAGVPGGYRVSAAISVAARDAFGQVCGKLTVQRGRAVAKYGC